MHNWLPYLLHLSDPTLPIGAYTHSGGLETYVQQGLIKDAGDAAAFIRNMLEHNLPYNDALFTVMAYRAALAADAVILLELDQECTALKAPQELRMASQKLGVRLLKLLSPLVKHAMGENYQAKIRTGEATGHYCLVFGIYAAFAGIPLEEALTAFYYNAATGMVTNSVKLVPLGQQQGQQLLFELLPQLPALVAHTLTIPRDMAGRCSFGFDIRSMQHERLYSRLYMS
ncbi:urease accessory protein UreF [Chitinophaga rhizophila]|uniref:Urease accessory protein UreF n=1 Tax=Chitinophaga rhizophila TaxID=2866212 RepID=A0ABS7G9U7_9BACT|nr:urease accessory protein UreF [Chitinophaga rhizophila]MBW8684428.1 urease accessory protein UreF [Chitinophaga rhizophila]